MSDYIETIIIGGGQAGLAVSYYLSQMGREHLVLEQAAQAGNAWRNQRWDSFTFVTPNWMIRLPGAEYQGDDPDGYLPRDQIVRYFEGYVERFRLPVRYGVHVTAVERSEAGYLVQTGQGSYRTANVVIATGFFQKPKLPLSVPIYPLGLCSCIPANTATRGNSLQARCWWSGRGNRAARSLRSCT